MTYKAIFVVMPVIAILFGVIPAAMAQTNLHQKFISCYKTVTPADIQHAFAAIKVPKFMASMEKEAIANMTKPIPQVSPFNNTALNNVVNLESDKITIPIANCMRSLGGG